MLDESAGCCQGERKMANGFSAEMRWTEGVGEGSADGPAIPALSRPHDFEDAIEAAGSERGLSWWGEGAG